LMAILQEVIKLQRDARLSR